LQLVPITDSLIRRTEEPKICKMWLLAVSHTVSAHVESHKNSVGRRAPHP